MVVLNQSIHSALECNLRLLPDRDNIKGKHGNVEFSDSHIPLFSEENAISSMMSHCNYQIVSIFVEDMSAFFNHFSSA